MTITIILMAIAIVVQSFVVGYLLKCSKMHSKSIIDLAKAGQDNSESIMRLTKVISDLHKRI